MATPMKYLIEGILPKHKLNIVAGPSGAGKTTFLFNLIRDWSQGKDVLGHTSYPEPYIYIALDRAADEIENRIEAAGLDPDAIPHLSILEEWLTFESVLSQIPPGVKVIFLDGFARVCPGGRLNDYNTVAGFCSKVTKLCQEKDLTIIGVAHATKVKEGENFLHARHRVLGSVAWGGFTSTLIFIDEVEPGKVGDTKRRVQVLPRTAKAEEHYFVLNEVGGFVSASSEILAECTKERDIALAFYADLDFDTPYRATQLIDLAGRWSIPERTTYNLIKKWADDGSLKKTSDGRAYVKESSKDINSGGGEGSQGKT